MAIDYLTIGHICHDVTPDGLVTGGTVAYSGRTAQVLGCKTAVLTSAHPDDDWLAALGDIELCRIPAAATTTFENVYTPNGRIQTLHHVADRLLASHIPSDWMHPAILHLGPLTNEVEAEIVYQFPNSLIGLTPQGWMRRWGSDGRVFAREWPLAQTILPLATAVVLSEEDLLSPEMLTQYREWSRLLVLTRGWAGCTVFMGDENRHFPTAKVEEREFTGAGDIFAAAYFVRLHQTGGNPWAAAEFANQIASQSVTQAGIDAKMAQIQRYLETRI
ncbi:MAG: hypothetical protein KC423_04170 [Anaerolineales bacterium]|nr:hypothetical protein [Anaerolineales bacterium]